MLRGALHVAFIALLTVLTQIGGIAWALALLTRRRLLAFIAAYVALSLAALALAPLTGRTALSCTADGPLQMQSLLYCALNRHYVTPELARALNDHAAEVDRAHPGTVTLVLDANFPFLTGFPLLPHLSHDDGEKVDLAFHYADATGYLPGRTRSPLDYFAFEEGPTDCPEPRLTLRWDMDWLQPLWRDYTLEPDRMRTALRALDNDPRVAKIFLEPHLKSRLMPDSAKIRFQGCRAARHDDHIHLQLCPQGNATHDSIPLHRHTRPARMDRL